MFIADMHCDSILEVNSQRGLRSKYNMSGEHPHLQFFASWVACKGESAPARRKRLMRLLDVYLAERSRLGLVAVESAVDLNFAIECEKDASIFAIEGGGGLFADSEELINLYRAGLRVLGIAWDTNELASSSFDTVDNGLSPAGRELVTRASEMGIILDVSHLSDRSTAELLDITPYPVIATHSNFREICSHPRNLPRSLASKIVARGGVIGLNLCPDFVTDDCKPDMTDLLRHVDFALENYGEDSLGFGFDIDGTDGKYPKGLGEECSIHDSVIELLSKHYSSSVVEKLAGLNVVNFLKNNL
ncbi:MAG: dipeptidase [Clostridia bacterium]|nr:dipeptidase [Clostridia bacterium]